MKDSYMIEKLYPYFHFLLKANYSHPIMKNAFIKFFVYSPFWDPMGLKRLRRHLNLTKVRKIFDLTQMIFDLNL